jgi:hypothetical protein
VTGNRTAAIVVALVLDVAAFASIWRSTAHGRRAKIFWTIAVVCIPALGALGWFALGRERRRPS